MNGKMHLQPSSQVSVGGIESGAGAPGIEEFGVEIQPWPKAVDGAALLNELERVLKRFVVLPKWAAETLALWVVHTYAFELRHVSTYIGVESPERRCGKTTLLDVLQRLVNRPAVTANISSSAFFRAIGELRPTLMIDEADTFLRTNNPLRGILNAGYTKETAYVVRTARETRNGPGESTTTSAPPPGNNESACFRPNRRDAEAHVGQARYWRVARFSCWCPKVIALIGRLPGTLADRCIVIRMQRKTQSEPCERIRTMNATTLRRKCARFVQDHAREIARARPALPVELNDRAADIWEPLLVVADLAGGTWPEAARRAAVGLSADGDAHNPMSSLLVDIAVSSGGETRIFSHVLVGKLNRCLDRPWGELTSGKEITELWLSKRLRPYGIRPRNVRIGDRQGKGYCLEDFREAFLRYVPLSAVNALTELRAKNTE
jgi:hypothetical protein